MVSITDDGSFNLPHENPRCSFAVLQPLQFLCRSYILCDFMMEATGCLAWGAAGLAKPASRKPQPILPIFTAPSRAFSFGIVRNHGHCRLAKSSHRGSQFNSIAGDGAHGRPLSPPSRLNASEAGLSGNRQSTRESNITKCCEQLQKPGVHSSVVSVSCTAVSTSLRIPSPIPQPRPNTSCSASRSGNPVPLSLTRSRSFVIGLRSTIARRIRNNRPAAPRQQGRCSYLEKSKSQRLFAFFAFFSLASPDRH